MHSDPCTTGSIVPVRALIGRDIGTASEGTVTSGTAIGLSIALCKQMGADVDGNTVTVIPVHGHGSITACRSWPSTGWNDDDMRAALSLVPMSV